MADLDDDDYESFELDRDSATPAASRDLAEVDDSDESGDDEDFDDDELDDAEDEEIDFVIAGYREDGQAVVSSLNNDLANDLEELIIQLRRLPGDAGVIGFVSLVEEVAIIVRVRGQHVQVLLSDGAAAADWPIAHDIADYLGIDVPETDDDDDDDSEPMGDLGILADLGVSEFDLTALCDDLDLSSDQLLSEVADKINIGSEFRRVAETALR